MSSGFAVKATGIGFAALALAATGCGGGKSETASTPAAEPKQIEAEPVQPAQPAAEIAPAPEVAAETATAEPAAPVTGDPVKGKRSFLKCLACHSIAMGENKIGPSLYKIVGAPAGKAENFKYSDAIASSGIIWTEEMLDAYLENPAKFRPGNKMLFPGLPTAQERADVIAYLKSVE
jgi:cytochrome c